MHLKDLTVWAFVVLCTMHARAVDLPAFPAPTQDQAQTWYLLARSNYFNAAPNATSAWKFAEACFEWAEFATNEAQRASLAEEGIVAAEYAVKAEPKNPAAHFFLAMNKGQLARTKTLGALPLVKEMEESFLRSIKLDPKFEHAAAYRSLGMLYLDAPGWPASIGSRSKARRHLEKAVELSPEYPTNHLAVMDAYLRWEERAALRAAMARYRRLLPNARQTYTAARWKNSWRTWDAEWSGLVEKSRNLD